MMEDLSQEQPVRALPSLGLRTCRFEFLESPADDEDREFDERPVSVRLVVPGIRHVQWKTDSRQVECWMVFWTGSLAGAELDRLVAEAGDFAPDASLSRLRGFALAGLDLDVEALHTDEPQRLTTAPPADVLDSGVSLIAAHDVQFAGQTIAAESSLVVHAGANYRDWTIEVHTSGGHAQRRALQLSGVWEGSVRYAETFPEVDRASLIDQVGSDLFSPEERGGNLWMRRVSGPFANRDIFWETGLELRVCRIESDGFRMQLIYLGGARWLEDDEAHPPERIHTPVDSRT